MAKGSVFFANMKRKNLLFDDKCQKITIFAVEYKKNIDMKKILFIIGSLRAKSFNRQVANMAKEIILS